MDKKDKRILEELIINSRIPINQLAKKVGVSREVALYRIKKLKKDIIKGFNTIVNVKQLGYSRFACFFQLKNISAEEENKFIEFLVNHDFVTYMGPVIGKWNVIFDILVIDNQHMENIIKDITEEVSKYLENYMVIGIGMEEEIFPTKLIGIKKSIKRYSLLKEHKVDIMDKKILGLLSNNSRVEYKEISNKLGLTSNAIKYRIKNLERYGIISGYTISLDFRKLGYEWHNIQLKLNNLVEITKLIPFFRNHLSVVYYFKHIGNEDWNIDIGVIVENSLGLRNFILELRERFGDVVKVHDTYIIFDVLKEHSPKGIFRNP